LDVQELDAKLDLLRHQLKTMPETAEVDSLTKSRAEVTDQTRDAQIRVGDLTREQKKADADVEQVRTRRTRDQDRIVQGLVSNPKDLERMQHEMVSLERRISELEDNELEVMEQLETAQHELVELTSMVAETDEMLAAATRRRDEKAGSLNEQLIGVAEERRETASALPEDLMALYVRLRKQKDGVGAAALRSRRCGGCSLEVNPAELGVIAKAPSNEVLRCEECSRILVRTSESGI
jgi:predicted  nucleic acid-binding Zn-ribbon protein